MIVADATDARGNPFCTRHVRPGRMPPLDAAGRPLDIPGMLVSLASLGGSAALVGPHGSGKTTLLAHLAAALEANGGRVERVRLRGWRDLVSLARAVARSAGGGTVCVDSWERLGRPWTGVVRWFARRRGARLLVTAHHRGALPTLWECSTSTALLTALTDRLRVDPAIGQHDVEEAFQRAAGDIREALFLLYDRFEERARAGGR